MSGPLWDVGDEAAIELLESDEVPFAAALERVDSTTLDAIETEIAQLGIDPVTVDSCQGSTQALQHESQPANTSPLLGAQPQSSAAQAKQGKPAKKVTASHCGSAMST